MDNFDNFYKNDDDNNEKFEHDMYISRNDFPREPQGPKHSEKWSKKNIVTVVLLSVIAFVLIVNAVILLTLKSSIAEEYAQSMSYQAMIEYRGAIDDVLANTSLVDDITSSAADRTVDRLDTEIGRYVAEQSLNSVVKIVCAASGRTSKASGFLINEGTERYVLTNAHVVTYKDKQPFLEDKTRIFSTITCSFYNTSSPSYNLEVVAYDESVDLALCKFKDTIPSNTTHKAIKFTKTNSAVSYGESVVLLGNPEGLGIAVSVGAISIPQVKLSGWGEGYLVMTDAAVNPGNSGGPMLNKHGVCVGVVESKLVSSNIDNMGFAVAVESVISFLNAIQTEKNITIGYKLV